MTRSDDVDRTMPEELLSEWQRIVDLVARIAGVPVGLIMHLCGQEIEVLVSSTTKGNPYHEGEKDTLFGSGLYCERVIESQEKLLVPNALQSVHTRIVMLLSLEVLVQDLNNPLVHLTVVLP